MLRLFLEVLVIMESELTIIELIEASNVRVAQAFADWYMVLIGAEGTDGCDNDN